MNFRWNGSDLISIDGKNIDALMDSEAFSTISSECEILQLVLDFLEENEIENEELVKKIKYKIEDDALDLTNDWLL